MKITRFAPSPTGFLHIGGLRTALYNFFVARKTGGKLLLRFEDTDRTRFVEGAVENMLTNLKKLGLEPDEGPHKPGKVGPYFQSERLEIYDKYINQLLEEGKAYKCFCTSERLDSLRKEQEELSLPTKYDRKCRFLTPEEIAEKEAQNLPYTVRLKVPENTDIVFNDGVRGKITINTKDVDDQVLRKTDGFPTYHLANIVDDHLMGVNMVIRGEEWIPSAPKHILIYDAFGWEKPDFYHLPLILGSDKKKLSKRNGDTSVEIYVEKGYLPEAILNHMAFLGWNPKNTKEIFSVEELIEAFDVENLSKSGAVFDIEKLDWYNSKYMMSTDLNELYEKFITYLGEYDKEFLDKISTFGDDYNKKILGEIRSKISKFDEFKEETSYLYSNDSSLNEDEIKNLMVNPKMKIEDVEVAKKGLELALEVIKNNDFSEKEEWKNAFIEAIKEAGMKNGQVLWPTRVALSQKEFSIGALELIFIIGKEKSSEIIENLLKKI